MSLSLPPYVFNPLYIYLRFADICKFFSQHIKIKMLSFDFIRQWPNFLPHHNEWKILACICVMNCKLSMNCFIPVWLIGSWSTTINFPLNKYLFYFFQTVFDFKCLWKEVTYEYCRYYKYCKYMSYINIYLVYGKYQFLKQLKTNAFFFCKKKTEI